MHCLVRFGDHSRLLFLLRNQIFSSSYYLYLSFLLEKAHHGRKVILRGRGGLESSFEWMRIGGGG